MKRIAFVFSTAPHGTAAGREGLDALLATSALTDDLTVFFIADGVFQLLSGQSPMQCWRVITLPLLNCWVCTTLNSAGFVRLHCANAG